MTKPSNSISIDRGVELTRTGDLWLFRGHTAADRAIQVSTNSPVNHVGMAVVLEDLPPLMWHAELGRSLPDLWTGTHHRGVQLHDLRASVLVWTQKYGQRGWIRQLDQVVSEEMEDAVLTTIARLSGTPFPSTMRLASRWLKGRVPNLRKGPVANTDKELEFAYCAEVVAVTYESMGLLEPGRRTAWYDAGRFWSGDSLPLREGARLGGEIKVEIPTDAVAGTTAPSAARRSRSESLLHRLRLRKQ